MNKYLLALLAGGAAALSVLLLSFIEQQSNHLALLMAPFGATMVLVFGLPDSPLAKPKNVIGGHMLTAFIGVICAQLLPVSPESLAVATGFGISLMILTKTTHPPAGANPLLIMLTGQSWSFLVTPVLFGAVTIVLLSQIYRKLWQKLNVKA